MYHIWSADNNLLGYTRCEEFSVVCYNEGSNAAYQITIDMRILLRSWVMLFRIDSCQSTPTLCCRLIRICWTWQNRILAKNAKNHFLCIKIAHFPKSFFRSPSRIVFSLQLRISTITRFVGCAQKMSIWRRFLLLKVKLYMDGLYKITHGSNRNVVWLLSFTRRIHFHMTTSKVQFVANVRCIVHNGMELKIIIIWISIPAILMAFF